LQHDNFVTEGLFLPVNIMLKGHPFLTLHDCLLNIYSATSSFLEAVVFAHKHAVMTKEAPPCRPNYIRFSSFITLLSSIKESITSKH
jgi:hypothetical protein